MHTICPLFTQLPMLEEGILPCVTGFIASDPSGTLTTLGRGGSDLTASIVGNAVDATGRKIKKLSDTDAANLGHLSLLKDRHTRGVLKSKRYLCEAAARSGQLEELKAFRAKNFPWNQWTCAYAAEGGHLEVLKWARANGCPWDEQTRYLAASMGYVET